MAIQYSEDGQRMLAPGEYASFEEYPKGKQLIEAVMSEKYPVIIYGGSVRGGKTYGAIAASMIQSKRYPRYRTALVRDTLTNLKKNTYPTCLKCIPPSFVKKHTLESSGYVWKFTNGSEFFFFSENIKNDKELNSWDGMEANMIILEQIDGMTKKVFLKALERVGAYFIPHVQKQPFPQIIITLNPCNTWQRDLFYDPYKKGTLRKDWLFIEANSNDNPFMTEAYRKNLLNLQEVNPIRYRRYVLGDWDAKEKTGDEYYSTFVSPPSDTSHVEDCFSRYKQDGRLHLAWDFNTKPYISLEISQVYFNPELGTIDYCTIDEICIDFKDAGELPLQSTLLEFLSEDRPYRYHKGLIQIFGDSSGSNTKTNALSDYQTIMLFLQPTPRDYWQRTMVNGSMQDIDPYPQYAEYGCEFTIKNETIKYNPPLALRKKFMNMLFAGQVSIVPNIRDSKLSSQYGKTPIRYVIDPRCKMLIKDYTNVEEDPVKPGHKMKKGTKHVELTHTSDAEEYKFCVALRAEFEAVKNMI